MSPTRAELLGHAIPFETNRTTIFGGSVNEEAFLKDKSGWRRFMNLHVKRCDWQALKEINLQQLWAQAHAEWLAAGGAASGCWFLNEAELALQYKRASPL